MVKEINQVTRVLTDLQERNHNDLTNRDAAGAHPASAITGITTITNLNQIPTRLHNDLQSRNAIATHPSESVGTFEPSSLFPQDIGKNWQDLGAISVSPAGRINTISYLGNGVAIAGDNRRRIFRSTDYGKTWTNLGTIATGSILRSTYLGSGIALFGVDDGHIFRSTDYGNTWTDLIDLGVFSVTSMIYIGNGITIVGNSEGNIFRSTDFGATWTDLGVIATNDIDSAMYFDNGITIITDSNGHVFRSTNFGATWTDLGVVLTANVTRTASYLGNGVGIIGNDAKQIFRSTDSGATWTNLGIITSISIFSAIYLGNGVALVGDQGNAFGARIYRSTDYGATWTNLGVITSDTVETLEYCGNGVILAGSDDGHIYRSDIAYKTDEAAANYPRTQVDQTTSRLLNTTYTNSDNIRSLMILVGVRCQTTAGADTAYAQAKSDSATPPVTVASPIVGIQSGLAGEDNNFQLVAVIFPGRNYRVDSTTGGTPGTVTLDKWFEMFI